MSAEAFFYLFFILIFIGVVCSIVFWTAKNGVPPMPTAPAVSKTVFTNLPFLNLIEGKIYDLGSGWGSLIFPLGKEYPARCVIGYENSLIPYLFSVIRSQVTAGRHIKVFYKNFYNSSLSDASLVFCYLYPGAMLQLKTKFEKELKPGCYVVSNTFAIPGWTPYDVWKASDLYETKIYVYRISNFDSRS